MLMKAGVAYVSVIKNPSGALWTIQKPPVRARPEAFTTTAFISPKLGECRTVLLLGFLFGYCLLSAHFSGNIAWGSEKHSKYLELSLT